MDFSPDMNTLPPILQEQSHINKFKRYARTIRTQTRWIQNNLADVNETKCVQRSITSRRESTQPSFNLNAFKSHVCSSGNVGSTARSHLVKPPWMRTQSDLKVLVSIVNKLKSFERYPQTVREQLCKVLYYECFEDGRIVVRQGDAGYSFYFILSGGVSVEVSEKDEKTGQYITQTVNEMYAGEMFGEVSLLHNIQRTATIICKGMAEFLRIDKPDFDMVLKSSYQQEYTSRMDYLRSLPEFDDFSRKELQQLMAKCKFVEYEHNKVLQRGNSTDGDEYVYFIRSGRCHVIKEMKLVTRSIPFKKPQLILPSQESHSNFKWTKFDTMKKFFLRVYVLKEGRFFGVGEDHRDTSVITVGKVQIVQVPRKTLLNIKHGLLLSFMRDKVMEVFPSPIDIFRSFEEDAKWKAYKKQAVLHSLQKRQNHLFMPSFEDVPLSIRNLYPDYKELYATPHFSMI